MKYARLIVFPALNIVHVISQGLKVELRVFEGNAPGGGRSRNRTLYLGTILQRRSKVDWVGQNFEEQERGKKMIGKRRQ